MICTRPDLCYIVSKLSQFMHKPTKFHLNAAKHVLRYLKGTKEYGLKFCKSNDPIQIVGYSDSDWGSSEDRKSISGYCFQLNDQSSFISWKSKKQATVALSSCEAEYIALTHCIQEAKFIKQLLTDLSFQSDITISVDNQGAIKLAQNPVFHERSKHIDIRHHFIRDEIASGNVKLVYVHTSENLADIFTKPVIHSKLLSSSSICRTSVSLILHCTSFNTVFHFFYES